MTRLLQEVNLDTNQFVAVWPAAVKKGQRRLLALSKWLPERNVWGMRGEAEERWRQLCEMAAEEQDPQKLMQLVDEINRLLRAKEQRLLSVEAGRKQQGAA